MCSRKNVVSIRMNDAEYTEKARNAETVEKMSALSSQNSTLRSSVQELSLENENLKTLSDDLREQVNLSNVEAVISAQKSKEKTEEQYKELIDSTKEKCRKKIAEAEKKAQKIILNTPELDNGLTLHSLRASCVSILAHQGVDIKNIQDWVGHSDIATTMNVYARVNEDEKKKVAQTMSSALFATRKNA